jgi:hypothetical protein
LSLAFSFALSLAGTLAFALALSIAGAAVPLLALFLADGAFFFGLGRSGVSGSAATLVAFG